MLSRFRLFFLYEIKKKKLKSQLSCLVLFGILYRGLYIFLHINFWFVFFQWIFFSLFIFVLVYSTLRIAPHLVNSFMIRWFSMGLFMHCFVLFKRRRILKPKFFIKFKCSGKKCILDVHCTSIYHKVSYYVNGWLIINNVILRY